MRSSIDLLYGGIYTTVEPERQPWRGFVNSVCQYRGLPVHRGAKPNPPTTPHFAEKKSLRLEGENLFTFWPIFRHMGRVLEGALIVVTVIQVATANAAKGFWRSAGGIAGWWE